MFFKLSPKTVHHGIPKPIGWVMYQFSYVNRLIETKSCIGLLEKTGAVYGNSDSPVNY